MSVAGGAVNLRFTLADVEAAAAFSTTHLGFRLRASAGVRFPSDVAGGPGGAQAVLDDASGDRVELVQPA